MSVMQEATAPARPSPASLLSPARRMQSSFWTAGRQRRPVVQRNRVVERMLSACADRICIVLSPEKTDVIAYYARHRAAERFCYVVQERPLGLCDALFRALQVMRDDEDVLIGLPDTVWFPESGFSVLPESEFSFLLFPVDEPQRFDAVLTSGGMVTEVQVKSAHPRTNWVWGAFRMPAATFRALVSWTTAVPDKPFRWAPAGRVDARAPCSTSARRGC